MAYGGLISQLQKTLTPLGIRYERRFFKGNLDKEIAHLWVDINRHGTAMIDHIGIERWVSFARLGS